ncbi:type II toxin-antitoxin system RelE/ParE family toxin [Streptomyces smaragdinus]|uniref:type II toxin-antitoxin system RelE/ParE family toxin n=1 Tax=Streptomyces smaragdinus TaxID=2585196 RepID=UPI002B215E11|nr:type II toxin-antitoxin system RelE/ParE family toxin [Streptomyces smaragdinus]
MSWPIVVVEPALTWLHELRKSDRDSARQAGAALTILSEEGPALGRPLVDTLAGSNLTHLKELRPVRAGAARSA